MSNIAHNQPITTPQALALLLALRAHVKAPPSPDEWRMHAESMQERFDCTAHGIMALSADLFEFKPQDEFKLNQPIVNSLARCVMINDDNQFALYGGQAWEMSSLADYLPPANQQDASASIISDACAHDVGLALAYMLADANICPRRMANGRFPQLISDYRPAEHSIGAHKNEARVLYKQLRAAQQQAEQWQRGIKIATRVVNKATAHVEFLREDLAWQIKQPNLTPGCQRKKDESRERLKRAESGEFVALQILGDIRGYAADNLQSQHCARAALSTAQHYAVAQAA